MMGCHRESGASNIACPTECVPAPTGFSFGQNVNVVFTHALSNPT